MEEIAQQTWRDGRIVRERFFYASRFTLHAVTSYIWNR
jgi:hypothetical protein